LVARKGRFVEQQRARPRRREPVGRNRSRGARADDDRVEPLHVTRLQWPTFPGVCPSGQRERAVNPSAMPTEVRILPPPLDSPAGAQYLLKRREEPPGISRA